MATHGEPDPEPDSGPAAGITRTVGVPPELDGQRLDRVLAQLLDGLSRDRCRELIEDGLVTLDGVPAKRPSQSVAAGVRIGAEIQLRDRTRSGNSGGGELRVVHEDEHLVVIDKPAGMVAHPSGTVRGGTVAELAAARWGALPDPQGSADEQRSGIVHRLDADTTGLMVLARTEAAATGLLAQFRERQVEKHYLAIVHGEPRFDSDWIDAPVGRDPRHPEKMAALRPGEGREASTFYTTLERLGCASLVEARPKTGRTHQIRVHLTHVGHPLVGDRLYRPRSQRPLPREAPTPARQALHAAELEFQHPVTGEALRFEAPLPDDLERLLDWLRDPDRVK